MKRATLLAIVVLGFAVFGSMAGDKAEAVTVKGDLLCAKCSLGEEKWEGCQNVVRVETDGEAQHYYLVMNDVTEKYGHVCKGKKYVEVTGAVTEKDGKTWIEPTTMKEVEKS